MAFTRCLCITLLQHIYFLTLSIEIFRDLNFFYLRDDVWGKNHQYILDNVKGLNNELPAINMYAFEVENKLEIIK